MQYSILFRWFVLLTFASELAAQPPGSPGEAHPGLGQPPVSGATEPAWYRDVLVGLEVGPTGAQFGNSDPEDRVYCRHFDGQEIVRRSVEAGAEYLVIWARDGDYAYYDSKLLPKAPGLEDRDVLRETVTAARAHQLPIIAYCVVQQGGHYLKLHPEWEMRGSEDQPLGRFCFNSGYLDGMKAIVSEQLTYGIDGFHIDMLDHGFGPPYGCWCDTCRQLFQQRYGRALPTGVTWDDGWDQMLQFRYDSSQRFEQELTRHIKSINPRVTVDYNYHGNPPFSFEVGQRPVQHADNGDFVTGETGIWGFSALGVGLNAQFYRAATPEKPVQIAMQRGVRMYHDQTSRPLNDLRWELLTLLAHGAFVTVIDKTAFDGSLDPEAYDRFGQLIAEAERQRAHFGHQPVQEVGIYFSSRTRDWLGREEPSRYFQSFQGAHRGCVLEHLPFGVLLEENVTPEALRKFPVIVLPNVGILSPQEIEWLGDYVRGGGNLIVTGHTGQFDPWGNRSEASPFNELIGAETIRQLDSADNWIRLPSAESSAAADADRVLADSIPSGWPFLVMGPATVYQPTTAKPLGELIRPHRTARQQQGKMGTEWPLSGDQPVGPAILINRVGAGQVLTFAASPDFATASEHPVVEARKLFRNAVRWLNPTPRVRIEAPAHVEAVVTDDPAARRLRIHLLAYQPTPQPTPPRNRPYTIPGLIEDNPLFRVRVTVAGGIAQAGATHPATRLTQTGNRLAATIESIHEVLLIDYPADAPE